MLTYSVICIILIHQVRLKPPKEAYVKFERNLGGTWDSESYGAGVLRASFIVRLILNN